MWQKAPGTAEDETSLKPGNIMKLGVWFFQGERPEESQFFDIGSIRSIGFQEQRMNNKSSFERRHKISQPGTSDNMFGGMGVIFHLLTQTGNRNPKDFLIITVFRSPNTGQQFFS